jgi:S-DNA-T family DNA segregation ATPase FtsK/SpoIIIE
MFVITKDDVSPSPEFVMEYLKDLRGIKSSGAAKDTFKKLLDDGALGANMANHEWARLCIAYHLAQTSSDASADEALHEAPDANGTEVPSLSTCFQSEWRFWLALICQGMVQHVQGAHKVFEPLHVSKRINALWHAGAMDLKSRYDALSGAYPNKADLRSVWLTELAGKVCVEVGKKAADGVIVDVATAQQNVLGLQEALRKIDLSPVIEGPAHGVRYDAYELQFHAANEGEWLTKKIGQLCSELGCDETGLTVQRCTDGRANRYVLQRLRPESEWFALDRSKFDQALAQMPSNMMLPVCVGADAFGVAQFEDLASAPHVLVGGTTGSGKSVCVNAMIQSLVHNKSADEVQLALFDPKQVDLAPYAQHPNLWQGQVFSENLVGGLTQLVEEMEARYTQFRALGVNNIRDLPATHRLPYIVVVVDELSDLVLSKDEQGAEDALIRLAIKARASGIHLILATQRPDSEVLSGQLRSNIPTRIALKVQKSTESKIILDDVGAEDLVGKGDRLVKWGKAAVLRHGYFF